MLQVLSLQHTKRFSNCCVSAYALNSVTRAAAQEEAGDKLKCSHMEVLSGQQDMDDLPKDAVIIQFMDPSSALGAGVPMLAASDVAELLVKGQVLSQTSVYGLPLLGVYVSLAEVLL